MTVHENILEGPLAKGTLVGRSTNGKTVRELADKDTAKKIIGRFKSGVEDVWLVFVAVCCFSFSVVKKIVELTQGIAFNKLNTKFWFMGIHEML